MLKLKENMNYGKKEQIKNVDNFNKQKKSIDIKNSNAENKCFLCLKRKVDNFRILFKVLYEDNDKQYFFSQKNSIKKDNKIHEILNKNLSKYSDVLIRPCECDIYCHIICLLQYTIVNLSLKCEECLKHYHYESENTNEKKKYCTLKIIVLLIIGIIFLFCGILCFIKFVIKNKKYTFWNYIFGIILVFLSFLFFSRSFGIFIYNKKHLQYSYPIFTDYNEDNQKLNKKIKEERLMKSFFNFENFLENILNYSVKDLITKKMFNKVWLATKMARNNQLIEFINENNKELFEQEYAKEKFIECAKKNKSNGHKMASACCAYGEESNMNTKSSLFNSNNKTNNFIKRQSCQLIGLKCKSNYRLSNFALNSSSKKDSAIFSCFLSDNQNDETININNSSELSSINENSSLKNGKNGTVIIPTHINLSNEKVGNSNKIKILNSIKPKNKNNKNIRKRISKSKKKKSGCFINEDKDINYIFSKLYSNREKQVSEENLLNRIKENK